MIFAAKPDRMSSRSDAYMVEMRPSFYRLSFDIYIHAIEYICSTINNLMKVCIWYEYEVQ